MGKCVSGGAMLKCSFGAAPSTLTVPPNNKVQAKMPIATIMDNKPGANIAPFGMCNSMANPTVAAATAAAMGALTPQPCTPVIAAPWVPGSPTVLIANFPTLNDSSKLMCNWAGVIEISNPGTTAIDIP